MAEQWRMKIVGSAFELYPRPVYLASYDLEFRGGWGCAELTADPSKAMTFDSLQAVFETWRQQSKTKPLRDTDGRPNRPLTAYTIEPERVTGGVG